MVPTPSAPVFEHHAPHRLGTGEAAPRLSWLVDGAAQGYRQHAARVQVLTTTPRGQQTRSTHHLPGPDQVLVPWPSAPVASRTRIAVRVQVDDGDAWSPWGPWGHVETGLLDPADWTARPVGPPPSQDGEPGRVRATFHLPADPVHARLYLSAHGLVEAEVNGRRVGDEELTPGWTSYRHRLRYATFDVTEQVRAGENALGLWLGDGWWRGRLGFGEGVERFYGDHLAVIAQLEVVDADGERHVVSSGPGWRTGRGPVRASGLYDGEHVDLRDDDPSWSTPEHDDATWGPVVVHELDPGSALVAPTGPPVRCVEELEPVSAVEREPGRWVLDFGQNHSGRLQVRASGPAGHQLRFRHAEVLVDGELHTAPLRSALATDVLVLDGTDVEWEPRFTVHGYRYAEVSGWSGPLRPGDVVSRVLSSDVPRTGWFRCSDPLLQRLHENVVWGARSNFVDVPTDCPQRDERLGWTGDLQVFAPTAAFLFGVTGMLTSWLRDLAAEQEELDWVPPFVPYLPLPPFTELPRDPMAVWGDVAVLTPDVLHTATGDAALLRAQLPSAVRWLQHVERSAGPGRVVHDTEQLGDWLDPAAPPENPFEATTDRFLVATAYFAHAAARLAATARTLGEDRLAHEQEVLAGEVRSAFAREFLTPDGRPRDDTQTAHALATVFGLWPDERTAAAGGRRLAELVREADGRIATGFAGTPVVCDALTRAGHVEEAYRLLQSTHCPSWLYTVLQGATTIWERWDAIRPDGSVNDPTMTSFNHYALGAVADWLHRVVAGLAPAAPGYRHVLFAPRPGGTLTSAGATHSSPYGTVSIDWSLAPEGMHVEVVVPPGVTATVDLPGAPPVQVEHGRHTFHQPVPRHPDQHDQHDAQEAL
ncbi:glycoside hydrolase family 78 protein [Kineococcus sp. TBRC 1896]|uniref:alpha-L-rhamnosidase n=1 Tax=Kineococcus mangrovi TaxID=1660183 RepID=A0ABV4I5W4_9ACTN